MFKSITSKMQSSKIPKKLGMALGFNPEMDFDIIV